MADESRLQFPPQAESLLQLLLIQLMSPVRLLVVAWLKLSLLLDVIRTLVVLLWLLLLVWLFIILGLLLQLFVIMGSRWWATEEEGTPPLLLLNCNWLGRVGRLPKEPLLFKLFCWLGWLWGRGWWWGFTLWLHEDPWAPLPPLDDDGGGGGMTKPFAKFFKCCCCLSNCCWIFCCCCCTCCCCKLSRIWARACKSWLFTESSRAIWKCI